MMASIGLVAHAPLATTSITVGLDFHSVSGRTIGEDVTARIVLKLPLRIVRIHTAGRFEHRTQVVEQESRQEDVENNHLCDSATFLKPDLRH